MAAARALARLRVPCSQQALGHLRPRLLVRAAAAGDSGNSCCGGNIFTCRRGDNLLRVSLLPAASVLAAAGLLQGAGLAVCDDSGSDRALRQKDQRTASSSTAATSQCPETNQELVHAIRIGNLHTIFQLLRSLRGGVDVLVTAHGETALAVACRVGNQRVVSALLRSGADPLKTDSLGASCMSIATAEGHLEVVRMLEDEGKVYADLDSHDALGYAPIHKAVMGGHLELVQYILGPAATRRQRVNALTVEEVTSPTTTIVVPASRLEGPLHVALRRLSKPHKNTGVKSTRHEMIQLLLDAGADPMLQDRDGDTPLHLCARQNDLSGLWLLLAETPDAGAARQLINKAGLTFPDEASKVSISARLTILLAPVLPRFARRKIAGILLNETLMILSM